MTLAIIEVIVAVQDDVRSGSGFEHRRYPHVSNLDANNTYKAKKLKRIDNNYTCTLFGCNFTFSSGSTCASIVKRTPFYGCYRNILLVLKVNFRCAAATLPESPSLEPL